jgi:Putative DNA-binding domain
MLFTPLHRVLGREPGPLTDDMLDDAVKAGVPETDDLDWKSALPAEKDLANSDLLKDIAAMANSGGGVVVFGVTEEQKRATGRVNIRDTNEAYERTLRRVAVSGIQPPIFGQGIHAARARPTRHTATCRTPSGSVLSRPFDRPGSLRSTSRCRRLPGSTFFRSTTSAMRSIDSPNSSARIGQLSTFGSTSVRYATSTVALRREDSAPSCGGTETSGSAAERRSRACRVKCVGRPLRQRGPIPKSARTA